MHFSREDYNNMRTLFKQNCVFCFPHPLEVAMTSSNFSVIFDIAPLVEGHLIIHSKEHWGCSGEVPPEFFPELMNIKEKTSAMIKSIYSTVSFYEHGRAGHCLADGLEHRLCHHFHLHVIPATINPTQSISNEFRQLQLRSFSEMPEMYERFDQYLYYETCTGEKYFYPVNKEIRRHFLRTIMAEKIGFPSRADWREYSNYHFVVQAQEKIEKYLGTDY